MSLGDCGRSCVYGVALGIVAGVLVHTFYTLYAGRSGPWYLAPLLVGPLVGLFIAYRLLQEWRASREYDKLVAARRRRME